MIGTTISHYNIIEKLGQGGMGVVYKAQDTTLDRIVALKFLPPHLADSAQDRARFTQEAKAAAALNHPNICTIYGIEEIDGKAFIAMEFVDGETLRQKMGSLSQKQAIEIGINIAEGLAAAHEKGVVHRDIKPENIMVRRDGICQIMDFGLAKLRTAASGINRLTKEGSTVGTAGYMSPEQIQGHDADHRSDIFSLGVVLYELFMGRPPFRGVHETALMYEIVNVDPVPMSAERPDIDPGLDAIVLDCMEKDPRERCQSVAEVARDLRRVKRESSRQRVSRITGTRPVFNASGQMPAAASGVADPRTSGAWSAVPAASPLPPSARPSRLPWLVAAVFLLTTLGALGYHFLAVKPAPEAEIVRSTILPPDRRQFDATVGGHAALSPDGRMLVFAAIDSTGRPLLWVRTLSSLVAVPLQGSEGGRYPFWSQDSRSIAFFADGKLKKVDARGGPVLTLCAAQNGRGGAWNKDGVIVFAPAAVTGLSRVSAAGGEPVALTKLDTSRGETSHRFPVFLPDGDHFLYLNQTSTAAATDSDAVFVCSLTDPSPSRLFHGTSNVAYSSGHLLFIRQFTLMAQPFDSTTLRFTGEAVPIAEKLIYDGARSRGYFSASDAGTLVYLTGSGNEPELALFDSHGERVEVLGERGVNRAQFSPDGKKIAYDKFDFQAGRSDIWIIDLDRRITSRLTSNSGNNIVPQWSPSGDSIVFSSNRTGHFGLYVKSAAGTGEERPLLLGSADYYATSWSSDGRWMSVSTLTDPKTGNDLWMLALTPTPQLTSFIRTEFSEWVGRFSPDAKWIVFQSDETGKNEVYVRAVDGSGVKFRISENGGDNPSWSHDGRKIYFGSPERRLFCASLHFTEAAPVVDSIAALFDFESRGIVGLSTTPTPDGRLFCARYQDGRVASSPLVLVQHWDMDLPRK